MSSWFRGDSQQQPPPRGSSNNNMPPPNSYRQQQQQRQPPPQVNYDSRIKIVDSPNDAIALSNVCFCYLMLSALN